MKPPAGPRRVRRNVRMTLEALEDRTVPATVVAPDLLTQYDTGVSVFDNITRAAQPKFAGTSMSPTGTVVTLMIDGAAAASTTLTHGGASTVTLQPAAPLADGTHVARFHDSSTGALSSPLTFTIDTTAPAAPAVPSLVDISDPGLAVFSVVGAAGDRLHIVLDGQDLGTVVATGSSQQITLDLSALDPAQAFDLWAIAEDAAGNVGAASPALTVDPQGPPPPPVAPAAPTNLFLDPASDTGVYDDDRITGLTTLTFGGDAGPGTLISLYVDGVLVDSQPADASGQFAVTAGSLAEGSHSVWVTASNGEESDPSDSITVEIDQTAPTITDAMIDPPALSPNDDGVQDTAAFTFTLSEPANVVAQFYDGSGASLGAVPLGLLDAGSHVFDLNVAGFLDGSYSIDLLAADLSGNPGALVSTTFTVDRIAPAAPTIVLQGGANTTTPIFTGTSDPDTIVDLYEGATYLGSALVAADGTWTAPEPLEEGTHTLTAFAWDDAGNSAGSTDLVVTIDTSAPAPDAGPDQSAAAGAPVTLTAAGFASATWSLVSASNGQAVPGVSGLSLSFTPSAAGTYVFRVDGLDTSGNAASDTVTVTVTASVNQPPSLGAVLATAPDILEDAADPDGILVADLVALLGVTDTPGSALGLAITAADTAHGAWQFAAHGTDWSALGDVASDVARLLVADALTRLRFLPAANWNGDATLAVRAWDQSDGRANGSTADVASGTSFSGASATIVQPVAAVNDAPVLPEVYTLTVLTATHDRPTSVGIGLVVLDVDATVMRVTASVDHGTLTLASTTGLTSLAGSGTATVTFEGPIAAVNAALASLVAQPAAGFVGTATLQVIADDLGGTGLGGAKQASTTRTFQVVNQPPRATVAGLNFSVTANQTLNVAAAPVASAFRDADGDALTFAVVNPPAKGTVTVNADGSFRYTPPAGFMGTTMFSLRAFDGTAWSDPVWITIVVSSPTGLRR